MEHLVFETPGVFIGKTGERLVVRKKEGDVHREEEIPFFRIEDITVTSSGVSFSAALLYECAVRGIKIAFLTPRGDPWAVLSSPFLTGTVKTRREQYRAYFDGRGLAFAREVVKSKIRNQGALLRYFGKYLRTADPPRFEELRATVGVILAARESAAAVEGGCVDDVRERLMGHEGAAAAAYWKGVAVIAGPATFPGRKQEGGDPFNAALNYGYGILYARALSCLINAGLDPFAGFLHADRPGKPSLELDLVEEFRQPVVDRGVIALHDRGPSPLALDGEGLLDCRSRKRAAGAVLAELEREVDFGGGRLTVASVMQRQARSLAAFLRGEGEYRGYSFKW